MVGLVGGLKGITELTGSISDLIALGFTIADQVKAQEGLQFNTYTFKLGGDSNPQSESGSAATPNNSSQPPKSMGSDIKGNKVKAVSNRFLSVFINDAPCLTFNVVLVKNGGYFGGYIQLSNFVN